MEGKEEIFLPKDPVQKIYPKFSSTRHDSLLKEVPEVKEKEKETNTAHGLDLFSTLKSAMRADAITRLLNDPDYKFKASMYMKEFELLKQSSVLNETELSFNENDEKRGASAMMLDIIFNKSKVCLNKFIVHEHK